MNSRSNAQTAATSPRAEPERPTRAVARASRDTTGPVIEVPYALITTATGEYEISGRVTDESEIAEVRFMGKVIPLTRGGRFEVSAYAPLGTRKIEIEAIDVWNNRAAETIVVTRAAPEARPVASFAALNPLNVAARPNPNAIAIIVGLERYENAPAATYADRDAQFFMDYAQRALGVPASNVKLLINYDARMISIKSVLKQWLPAVAKRDESDVYVFFAGHGLASADGERLYLLPYDANVGLLEDSALVRKEVFAALSRAEARSVTVFLDTCYSGGTRTEHSLVADARGIRVTAAPGELPDNFTVFSAATKEQLSASLPEARHGLFSYFLMRGLEGEADADGDRRLTVGELYRYLADAVPREAVRLGREQDPQLAGDPDRVLVRM